MGCISSCICPKPPIPDDSEQITQETEESNFSEGSNPSRHVDPLNQRTVLKAYTHSEIAIATQNFNQDYLLGQGGFGQVYRGEIKHPSSIIPIVCAIKCLAPGSFQGTRECVMEIQFLTRLTHPHLVRLFGFCMEGERVHLVYEYISNGSLDYHLYDLVEGQAPMTLGRRVKIIHQAAEALSFLHANKVIHRDFKPANILLNANFNVKLTDFGISREADPGKTHNSTTVLGSEGYLDPEYQLTGHLSMASDVFSFGVFVLAVLTGRRAESPGTSYEPKLYQWGQRILKEKNPSLSEILDQDIAESVDSNAAKRLVQRLLVISKVCMENKQKSRPDMADVLATISLMIQKYEIHYVLI